MVGVAGGEGGRPSRPNSAGNCSCGRKDVGLGGVGVPGVVRRLKRTSRGEIQVLLPPAGVLPKD